MSEIEPRYEFRAFGQSFGSVVEKMRRRTPVARFRESGEWYIVSGGSSENNAKIRYGTLDIKQLVARRSSLEQWSPRFKSPFPLSAEKILEEVFPAFGVDTPPLERAEYTQEQLLREIVSVHQDLVSVSVFKQRFGFELEGVLAEWAKVLVNGAALQTICLESVDPEAVLETRRAVGADELENVNYLLAIKRVIGMEPLPSDFVPSPG